MARRSLQIAVLLLLVLAGLGAFGRIYAFSQHRFFTIDEYQFGHATWLVAQGSLPYLDFFEHHFPLSYVIHAPLYWFDWDFVTAALLLRKTVFLYLAALSVLAGACTWAVVRNPYAALLSSFLPASFGFSLMSAVDYRADNFGAFYFAACLLLLEWNRRRQSPAIASGCGALAVLAACTTQKMAFVAGVTVVGMQLVQLAPLVPVWGRRSSSERLPFIARPAAFFGTALLVGSFLLAVAAVVGALPAGFEATILQAIEHERHYERFSIFEKGFVGPFWRSTRLSTVPIVLFAIGYLATRGGRFWVFPIAVSLAAGAMMAAPYPYNFVFLCYVTVLVAVRGFCMAVAWLEARMRYASGLALLLHGLALAAVADQLGFVADRKTNDHQLEILQKIETYGSSSDAVIDNAGGAMFSKHGSYYFHHGDAHREMFRDYFEQQLPLDYRRSQALFWIRDLRSRKLPKPVRDYLESHYVHAGGDLHVLGFREAPTQQAARSRTIDVIRAGSYFIHRNGPAALQRRARPGDLLLDGRPVETVRVELEVGSHEVTLRPESAGYVISLMPAPFFTSNRSRLHYSMMFEYK